MVVLPVVTIVTAMMPAPTFDEYRIWLHINRSRLYVHRLRRYVDGPRLDIDRLRLDINGLRINIYRGRMYIAWRSNHDVDTDTRRRRCSGEKKRAAQNKTGCDNGIFFHCHLPKVMSLLNTQALALDI